MTSKLSYLSDAHYFAIANVALRAAALDAVVEKLVSTLLRDNEPVVAFIVKNLNASRYAELLRLILVSDLPHKSREITALFSRIARCRQERNEIIHWISAPTGDTVTVRFAPVRSLDSSKDLTAPQIQKVADAAERLANELVLWLALRDAVHAPASPERLALISPRPSWVDFALKHWPKPPQVPRRRRRSSQA